MNATPARLVTEPELGDVTMGNNDKETPSASFVDDKGKQIAGSDGDAQCYSDAAKDYKRVDRKFHDNYAAFIPTIKCKMDTCNKTGFVLTIFTKGFDFKDSTTNRARGSVKAKDAAILRDTSHVKRQTLLKACAVVRHMPAAVAVSRHSRRPITTDKGPGD